MYLQLGRRPVVCVFVRNGIVPGIVVYIGVARLNGVRRHTAIVAVCQYRSQRSVQNPCHRRIGLRLESVIDPLAVAPRRNKAGTSEIGQVTRYLWLALA